VKTYLRNLEMRWLVVKIFVFYKTVLSGFVHGLGMVSPGGGAMVGCRFSPSCGDYGKQAIERHGIFLGMSLVFRRLVLCHPFYHGGYDPVPEVKQKLKSVSRV